MWLKNYIIKIIYHDDGLNRIDYTYFDIKKSNLLLLLDEGITLDKIANNHMKYVKRHNDPYIILNTKIVGQGT